MPPVFPSPLPFNFVCARTKVKRSRGKGANYVEDQRGGFLFVVVVTPLPAVAGIGFFLFLSLLFSGA